MRSSRRWWLCPKVPVGFALALALSSCDDAARGSGAGEDAERTIIDSLSIAATEIAFAFVDSIDLRPTLLRVGQSGDLWLIDQWTQRVALVDGLTGRLRWVMGREGGGPREFMAIRDAALVGDSMLAVLDARLGRVSLLSWSGRVVGHVPLSTPGSYEQLVALPDSTFVIHVADVLRESPLIRVSRSGTVLQRIAVPWTGYEEIHPMAAQLALAGTPSGTWVAAMLTGPRFFRFHGVEPLPGRARFAEYVEPPSVSTESSGDRTVSRLNMVHRAAARVTVADSTLLVLFEGASSQAGRLIDLHNMSDGAYVGTLVLADAPNDIQYARGTLYCFYQIPRPHVKTYRLRDALIAATQSASHDSSPGRGQEP